MGKIIIHNRSKKYSDVEAVQFVLSVMYRGRISDNGKQYCYATTNTKDEVVCYTGLNKHSDVFYVMDETPAPNTGEQLTLFDNTT